MPEPLRVVTVPAGTAGTWRVRASGEVDHSTASLLSQALATATRRGYAGVEVDLAEVTFFDCAGLRALVNATDAAGERLRLVAASESVQRVLDIFDPRPGGPVVSPVVSPGPVRAQDIHGGPGPRRPG